MLYFTSDLHLGHANAIDFTPRPFADVREMDVVLIDNINDTVGRDDELWILGDFTFKKNREKVREYRERINCRHVHLIYGNHDGDYTGSGIFQSAQHYRELKTDVGRVVLFHYPILEWSAAHYGSIHLHGHIHSTGEYNAENLKKRYADRMIGGHSPSFAELGLRIYDVGVDANGYRPVSLKEIAKLMKIPYPTVK